MRSKFKFQKWMVRLVLGWGLSCGAFASLQRSAFAWNDHQTLTRQSLQSVKEIQQKTVRFTPFEKMAQSLGFLNPLAFNESLQIRKTYRFENRLGERYAQELSWIEVVAGYSDEPDWGMDQELFSSEEYPGLWRAEYAFMGGRVGLASQAHRHMYWPAFRWSQPLRTFKVPPAQMFQAWGLAPERARVFVELSHRALATGHPYWAARFLGNALHYLQDVAQPFHAVQIPTKNFVVMPLLDAQGVGLKGYVQQMQNLVSYYHRTFEDYLARRLQGGREQELISALRGDSSSEGRDSLDVSERVRQMADRAVAQSAEAGRVAVAFFPELPADYLSVQIDPILSASDFDLRTDQHQEGQPEVRSEYYRVVSAMFQPMGRAVRALVREEAARTP